MDNKRKKSIQEGISNIIVGFLAVYGASYLIIPPFKEDLAMEDPIAIAIIALLFTLISIVRMYGLRIIFNYLGHD